MKFISKVTFADQWLDLEIYSSLFKSKLSTPENFYLIKLKLKLNSKVMHCKTYANEPIKRVDTTNLW